jgi:hypothetical protein
MPSRGEGVNGYYSHKNNSATRSPEVLVEMFREIRLPLSRASKNGVHRTVFTALPAYFFACILSSGFFFLPQCRLFRAHRRRRKKRSPS